MASCAHGHLRAQPSALLAPWSPFSVRPVDLSPPCAWHQWGPGAWPSARHVVGVHGHLLRGESIHSASRSCSFTLPNAGRSCGILPQPLEEVLRDGRCSRSKRGREGATPRASVSQRLEILDLQSPLSHPSLEVPFILATCPRRGLPRPLLRVSARPALPLSTSLPFSHCCVLESLSPTPPLAKAGATPPLPSFTVLSPTWVLHVHCSCVCCLSFPILV